MTFFPSGMAALAICGERVVAAMVAGTVVVMSWKISLLEMLL